MLVNRETLLLPVVGRRNDRSNQQEIVLDLFPPPIPTSGIRDNFKRGSVADFLTEKIQTGTVLI